jgi:hypothetical protein
VEEFNAHACEMRQCRSSQRHNDRSHADRRMAISAERRATGTPHLADKRIYRTEPSEKSNSKRLKSNGADFAAGMVVHGGNAEPIEEVGVQVTFVDHRDKTPMCGADHAHRRESWQHCLDAQTLFPA